MITRILLMPVPGKLVWFEVGYPALDLVDELDAQPYAHEGYFAGPYSVRHRELDRWGEAWFNPAVVATVTAMEE